MTIVTTALPMFTGALELLVTVLVGKVMVLVEDAVEDRVVVTNVLGVVMGCPKPLSNPRLIDIQSKSVQPKARVPLEDALRRVVLRDVVPGFKAARLKLTQTKSWQP